MPKCFDILLDKEPGVNSVISIFSPFLTFSFKTSGFMAHLESTFFSGRFSVWLVGVECSFAQMKKQIIFVISLLRRLCRHGRTLVQI